MIKFAKWLRTQFEFPIWIPVYLSPRKAIQTKAGECPASFFAPYKTNIEPFIRVATGDYVELKARVGRDNALAAILCSLAHEVVHYQQWFTKRKLSEAEANRKSRLLVRFYAETVPRP